MVKENTLLRMILLGVFSLFLIPSVFSAAAILDVLFNESAYEQVRYDPLGGTAGLYSNTGENQSTYSINGTITISNVHGTEAAHDILINVSGISNIYNVTYSSGATGTVPIFNTGSDYMILSIADLGAGVSTVFTYDVNVSNIAPPINMTASYSDSRIFAGLPVDITDTLSNDLNASLYTTTTCIYDINIVQNALTLNSTGILHNVTFDNSSLGGTDGGNASFSNANRTLTWDVRAGGCLNAGNSTDINYTVNTPAGVNSANTYSIINSTTTYRFNDTLSRIQTTEITAILNAYVEFEKYINNTLTGDNATWGVVSRVENPSDVDINLTSVSLWVSQRNATGTGFTNPSTLDQDTIGGGNLTTSYSPNILLNSSTGEWNNSGAEWFFNYTFSSSPIVWMDITNNIIINDGLQLTNRSVSYGINNVYVKDLYLATGYYLQISRNITRTAENNYTIFIQVVNLGTSPTPASQAVQVYNFIANTFNLTSPFVYSTTPFYTTSEANETLNDPVYNGTMYQFAILENNTIDASLNSYGGSINANNSWSVTYNVTGTGDFDFEDLFLTGVDPLNVGEYGATQAITLEGAYNFLSSKVEYVLGGVAVLGALLALLI